MMSAILISANQLSQLIRTSACPIIIDVRRRDAFDASDQMIATAAWRDPEQAAVWAADLAQGAPGDAFVVVYCVHGHEVSQGAAEALRSAGVDARFLEGGIEGFIEAGGETVVK
ncbi:MAG: rhodanese-like domain-containing protein [Proteobacteria bacterium]|nr:rhodanese-like domain-containing protein [Pseudomonadota bacterium]